MADAQCSLRQRMNDVLGVDRSRRPLAWAVGEARARAVPWGADHGLALSFEGDQDDGFHEGPLHRR